MEFYEVINNRHSIRQFEDKEIPRDILERTPLNWPIGLYALLLYILILIHDKRRSHVDGSAQFILIRLFKQPSNF